MALTDPRGPFYMRPTGLPVVVRRCLKCDKEFEAVAHFHICNPCTWANRKTERIYGQEGSMAPSWWH
jgi:hypothetical protein